MAGRCRKLFTGAQNEELKRKGNEEWTFVLKLKLNFVALVRERTIPTERPPLAGEVVPIFADRGCCVVSATDSHDR
jgi:hypothetical protein